MKKVTGQSLRLGGMFIEMLGVMGMMTGKGDIESLRLHSPAASWCRQPISCSPWAS